MTNSKKPYAQSVWDGLCGIYATINTVSYLHESFSEDDCEKLFHYIIKSGGDVTHNAVTDGIGFNDLWKIIQKVKRHLTRKVKLTVTRKKGLSTNDFFDTVDQMIRGNDAVAIVGLGDPWDHWTVIKEVKDKTILFHDSYGIKSMRKSSFSMVEVDGKTKIDYHQTFLVQHHK